MQPCRSRARALVFAAALITISLPVASASAIARDTQITTPSGTIYQAVNAGVEEGGTITIAGTAHGLAKPEVELRCYYGSGADSYREVTFKPVPVVAEGFSVTVPRDVFPGYRCTLRAVPVKYEEPAPEEVPSEFEGPTFVSSAFELEGPSEFAVSSSSLAGSFDFQSAGSYSLEGQLYSSTLHELVYSLYGEVDLNPFQTYAPKTRSPLLVDGANAYVSHAAVEAQERIETEHKAKVALTGMQPIVVEAPTFHEATHTLTFKEEEPIVKCATSGEFPPTFASCTGFQPTGVTLVRTWETSDEDHVAWLTETWRSTDHAAHSVNVRYYTEMDSQEKEAGVYLFPGTSAFATTTEGETISLPAGAGAILYKTNSKTPESGDGVNPQDALVYDTAPSEPLTVTRGSQTAAANVYETPYQLTVPAGESRTVRMAFVQGFALAEVRSLAEAALASYYPSVSIAAPANGASIETESPAVAVSGTASDSVALASLTVGGAPVAVGAGGAWSTSVALKPGANTITATATDQAGLSKSAAVTVTYTVPLATASVLGSVTSAGGKVTFTVACKGAAGTSCAVKAALATVEQTRAGKLIALLARKPRIKRKTVTVASAARTIPAGHSLKITLALNSTGRRLLARFHKLPAHLTVTLAGTPKATTLVSKSLTVKPAPKPRRRRRRR